MMVGPCCSCSLFFPSFMGEEDLSPQNIALTAKVMCIRKGCGPCIEWIHGKATARCNRLCCGRVSGCSEHVPPTQ